METGAADRYASGMQRTSRFALAAVAALGSCASTSAPTARLSIPEVAEPTAPRRVSADDAATTETPWETFSLSAGGLLVALDSGARFGPAGAGVELNFEDLFGLDTSTSSFRLEGTWRFTENHRHRASLGWVDLGRSGETTLQSDVTVDDTTVLPAGTGIKSGFGLQLIKADYSYSFFQDDRADLAAIFGMYVAPIDVSLEAVGLATYSDNFDVTAPLPLAGLRMDFALTPEWFLRSNLSLFYLEFDGYTGSMSDITAAVEYQAWKHVAIGFGVDSFRIGVEHEGDSNIPGVSSRGKIDIGYTGAMLYLKGIW